jgi:hypothetical protein
LPPRVPEGSETSRNDMKSRLRPSKCRGNNGKAGPLCSDCCSKVRFLFGLGP